MTNPNETATAVPLTHTERNLVRAALLAYEKMLRGNLSGRMGGKLEPAERAESERLLASVRAKLSAAAETEASALYDDLLA